MARGKTVVRKPIKTKEECVDMFVRQCQVKNLRPASITTYTIFINDFIEWMGDKTILDINSELVDDYKLFLYTQDLKSATIVSKVRNVRTFIYFLQSEHLISSFKIALPKQDEAFKEPYTKEELSKLMAVPESNNFVEWRTWALEAFLIGTGCRISTALNVKISDLDFSENFISFTHLKNRKVQLTPMSISLKKVLEMYLSLWQWTEEDYLFNNSYETGQIAISTAQQQIKRYNCGRGVKKHSAHLFRHTFSKNYIMAGGGVFQLQRLLGHSDISTTRRYVELYNADLAIDYNKLCPLDNI